MSVRCFRCKGKRSFLGLGGMTQTCEVCKGTGLSELFLEDVIVKLDDNFDVVLPNKKKAGRPRKEG